MDDLSPFIDDDDAFAGSSSQSGQTGGALDGDYVEIQNPTPQEIAQMNVMHRKQFGADIPLSFERATDVVGRPYENPQHTYVVCRKNGVITGMFIITYSSNTPTTRDLWSLCKNESTQGGFFDDMIKKYLVKNPQVAQLNLVVDHSNTEIMTELGRLLYYTSIGFRLVSTRHNGGAVFPRMYQLIYNKLFTGNSNIVFSFTVSDHAEDQPNMVNVISTNGVTMPIYIGFMRSMDQPFVMTGTRDTLMAPRAQLWHTKMRNQIATIVQQQNTTGLVGIDLASVPGIGDRGGDTRFVSNSKVLADALTRPLPPLDSMSLYFQLHHMLIVNTAFNSKVIRTAVVPENVIFVQCTMPGSTLAGNRTYFELIAEAIADAYKRDPVETLKRFGSKASLPISDINAEVLSAGNNTAGTSLYAASIMDKLGSTPVFTFCVKGRPSNSTPVYERDGQFPTTGGRQKGGDQTKTQFEIQIYLPGMKFINRTISQNTAYNPETRCFQGPRREDDRLGIGIYKILGGPVNNSSFKKIDTPETVRQFTSMNELYTYTTEYDNIRLAMSKTRPGIKTMLFSFGCATYPVPQGSDDLLYELSHRRSVVYYPRADEFLNYIRNKNVRLSTTEIACPTVQEQLQYTPNPRPTFQSYFNPDVPGRRHREQPLIPICGQQPLNLAAMGVDQDVYEEEEEEDVLANAGEGARPGVPDEDEEEEEEEDVIVPQPRPQRPVRQSQADEGVRNFARAIEERRERPVVPELEPSVLTDNMLSVLDTPYQQGMLKAMPGGEPQRITVPFRWEMQNPALQTYTIYKIVDITGTLSGFYHDLISDDKKVRKLYQYELTNVKPFPIPVMKMEGDPFVPQKAELNAVVDILDKQTNTMTEKTMTSIEMTPTLAGLTKLITFSDGYVFADVGPERNRSTHVIFSDDKHVFGMHVVLRTAPPPPRRPDRPNLEFLKNTQVRIKRISDGAFVPAIHIVDVQPRRLLGGEIAYLITMEDGSAYNNSLTEGGFVQNDHEILTQDGQVIPVQFQHGPRAPEPPQAPPQAPPATLLSQQAPESLFDKMFTSVVKKPEVPKEILPMGYDERVRQPGLVLHKDWQFVDPTLRPIQGQASPFIFPFINSEIYTLWDIVTETPSLYKRISFNKRQIQGYSIAYEDYDGMVLQKEGQPYFKLYKFVASPETASSLTQTPGVLVGQLPDFRRTFVLQPVPFPSEMLLQTKQRNDPIAITNLATQQTETYKYNSKFFDDRGFSVQGVAKDNGEVDPEFTFVQSDARDPNEEYSADFGPYGLIKVYRKDSESMKWKRRMEAEAKFRAERGYGGGTYRKKKRNSKSRRNNKKTYRRRR